MKSHPTFTAMASAIGLALLLIAGGCGDHAGKAVILISLDTLRQDHLGCYGYGRNTSPNLDRFAEEDAVLFESAYAQAPYTLSSHMSILTGLYPEAHGILNPVLKDGSGRTARLADGVTTLAETLKQGQFKTEAFTDGIFLGKRYGFDQGFDGYRDARLPKANENGFRKYRDALHKWIEEHRAEDFFLFIHTYDTHAPYVPPRQFRSRFRGKPPARELPSGSLQLCALLGCHGLLKINQYANLQDVVDVYDGCIAFVDNEVGKLFTLLKDLGLWDEALIVVISDHGESFMENGLMIGHGLCANNEETLIPFLMKLPDSRYAGRRVERVVESVDIMPTILAALGIPVPEEVQGQNLLQGLDEDRWQKDYAYGTSPESGNNHYLIKDGFKFIEAVNDPTGNLIKAQVLPMAPATAPRPEEPYYVMNDKAYFYDFTKDPLGISELFNRGDRAYDLRESKYEWQSEPILEADLVLKYKKAAYAIAAASAEQGRSYRVGAAHADPLSAEEMKQLNELGYGGVLAAADLDSQGSGGSNARSMDLKHDPPQTDRTLLDRGDQILWAFSRYTQRKSSRISPKVMAAGLEEARACFEAFKKENPDKSTWVDWRIRCLNIASRLLQDKK